jgi:hypothetical protein
MAASMNSILKIISSDLTYAIVWIAVAIPVLHLKLLRQPVFPFCGAVAYDPVGLWMLAV